MKRILWAALFYLTIHYSNAIANDSPAVYSVATGGLVLQKNEQIEMVSEELDISESKIKVTYQYLNTSDKDITTTVAFPMPAFDDSSQSSDTYMNQRPLDSFQIVVEQHEVPTKMHREVLIDGVDVANKFRHIGLIDEQIFDIHCIGAVEYIEGSCYKNKEQFENTQKIYGSGSAKIRETAYWDQLFPAGKKIEIGHEYTPLAGFEFSISKKDASKMCLDKGTENAFHKLARAALKQNESLTVFTTNHYDVAYILGTGRNWKGPIKNFKLILRDLEIINIPF